eukprot:1730677-Pleurochrysis_carterae.AAC.2
MSECDEREHVRIRITDLRVPSKMRVAEDVHVRSDGRDAAPQRRRAHRLHQVGVAQVALLGAQIDPRQKVREAQDWVLPAWHDEASRQIVWRRHASTHATGEPHGLVHV